MEIIHIDGSCDEVVCDLCLYDYTESLENGGAIVRGWAYCPRCWMRANANPQHGHVIINNPLTPFAAFVKAMRQRALAA